MGITITSTAFSAGNPVPAKFTGQGINISPDLAWSGAPTGLRSYAVICDDPDAPSGTWVHWTIWNIPPSTTSLPEGVASDETLPDGSIQGITSSGHSGYGGPMPPKGNAHHYYFRVYALDIMLTIDASALRSELDSAMQGQVLSQGQLMGTYQRR
jgi:Raf kinase inhibitor-like YbhB/YbcL family protein